MEKNRYSGSVAKFIKDGFHLANRFKQIIATKPCNKRPLQTLLTAKFLFIFMLYFHRILRYLESAYINPFESVHSFEESHVEESICSVNHPVGGNMECLFFRLHDGAVAPAKSTH